MIGRGDAGNGGDKRAGKSNDLQTQDARNVRLRSQQELFSCYHDLDNCNSTVPNKQSKDAAISQSLRFFSPWKYFIDGRNERQGKARQDGGKKGTATKGKLYQGQTCRKEGRKEKREKWKRDQPTN